MELKFDVNEALTQIAKGLNTTVEKVYPMLQKQVMVDFATELANMILFIAVTALYWYIFTKFAKRKIAISKESWRSEWEYTDEGLIPLVIGCVLGVITFIIIVYNIYALPQMIFNPDYYILEKMIDSLK